MRNLLDPLPSAALDIQTLHAMIVISSPMHLNRTNHFPDLHHLLLRERHVRSADILFEILDALGSWNDYKVVALSEDPGEDELRGCDTFLSGELLESVDELEILGEVLGVEARVVAAEVIRLKVLRGLVLARQHTAAQGRVGNDCDT